MFRVTVVDLSCARIMHTINYGERLTSAFAFQTTATKLLQCLWYALLHSLPHAHTHTPIHTCTHACQNAYNCIKTTNTTIGQIIRYLFTKYFSRSLIFLFCSLIFVFYITFGIVPLLCAFFAFCFIFFNFVRRRCCCCCDSFRFKFAWTYWNEVDFFLWQVGKSLLLCDIRVH